MCVCVECVHVHVHVGLGQCKTCIYEDRDSIAVIYHALHKYLHPPCRVWDIRTGQVINDLHHHEGPVNSLKFTTDTLVTGSDVSGF